MRADNDHPVVAAICGSHMDPNVTVTGALLAGQQSVPLLLLHVIEVSRELPVEASSSVALLSAESVLAAAQDRIKQDLLRFQGIGVRTEIRQARRASTAIVETSLEENASAIVVGSHRFLGEHDCDLGPTATHVLRHAVMPVVLCYEPIR